MPESIVSIEEVTDVIGNNSYSRYDGYRITTTERVLELLISNSQSCCESFGYFVSEDDLSQYMGREFRGLHITDTNRTGREFTKGWEPGQDPNAISLDDGDVMFVDVMTDIGSFQFAAYNAHNGYYGHTALITGRALTVPEVLVERGL